MKIKRHEKKKFSYPNATAAIPVLCNALNGTIETYVNIIHFNPEKK